MENCSEDDSTSCLVFYVNGKRIQDDHVDPEWTLLRYLRTKLRLCGTKLGCGEGGCGACTVMVSKMDRLNKKIIHLPVNACLAPVCSMHGLAVTTVEGIGSTKTKLHPVQERIAKAHGSQCGFCTPGIVMSMYTLLRNSPKPSMKELEVALQGNLCRCTGYRPIIEGFKTFTEEWEIVQNGHKLNVTNDNDICGMGDKCCKLQNGTNKEEDEVLFHSSEFIPYHPSQEPIFPPELKLYDKNDKEYVIFRGANVTWYRPITLSQLLELKEIYPDAKLVVGNTEVGVEMKFKQMVCPIIIQPVQIPELVKIQQTSKGVKIGASATLVDIETYIKQQIKEQPEYKTRIFRAVVEMMNRFAGKQIRSVGALGSNIMTGSPISDMIPLLMAAKSTLEFLSNKNGIREVTLDNNFFVGYRKTIIKPDEILFSILIPYTTEWQYFTAYKQARRREDDIAIVNEAVNVSFKPNTNLIEKISFGIGGMSFKTLSAPQTEAKLVGLPWNKSTVDLALDTLLEDLPLDPDAPGGMISYRRSLPISLFFKAFLSISLELQKYLPNIELDQRELSGASGFTSHDYKSSQYFQVVPETQEKIDAVHRPIVHMSAYKQATGEAVYNDDIPTFEGELYCGFVLSTKPHAKILNIDESEAMAMEGVRGFVSSKDVNKNFKWGYIFSEEDVFYTDKVTAVGQIIGLVVADTQAIAQRAAKKVKIIYQELEPVIISIEDAINHQSFYPSSPLIVKGDVDKVFKEAPHVLEGEGRMGGQEHFYFETQSCIVVPKAEDNEMEIISSTQTPSEMSSLISELLDIPQHKILTKVKRLGGGFGGKESKSIMLVLPVAVAAKKLNRPIRCMLDRDEDIIMTGGRHPFYYKYKIAFDNSGKMLACEAHLYSNAGYSRDVSLSIMNRAITHVDNAYKIPAWKIIGTPCKTNLPSNTAFRGFGGPQGMYLVETMIEQIAAYLNKDPFWIREINLYKQGDITQYNQLVENCTLDKCWKECVRTSDYVNRKKFIDGFNRSNKYKKRGISVIPTKFGIAFSMPYLNQSGALVLIYKDGSVLLSHGGIEMGQGLHTKMIQVASRALGIPVDKIHISETATDKVPNTSATAASSASDLNGMAIIDACNILNERLKPYKEAQPNGTWEEWVRSAYLDRVSLASTGFYKIKDVGYNYQTGEGRLYNYFTFGAGCSEVEIDTLTGDHQVLRTDIVMDLGESLNPAIDIGQIEGAFMQGYGLFVLEEMMYTPKGETITRGPGTYKIPGFGDIPIEFNVSLLKGVSNPRAVYSSKGIGEPPLFLASSIMFAIKDAIGAARDENNVTPGYFRLDAPVTSAKIRMACQDQITSKIQDDHVDPEWTLLYYLRTKLRLCGTKLGCGEGGCGACTVMVSKLDRIKNKIIHLPVNACLAPVCSMHGLAVTTVEGIGSTKTKLHPVQERIAKAHGSQCGFCTPGIVMSMYTLLRNSPKPTMKQMEVAFQGNLCRCTGYRPIIEGFKTFTEDWEIVQNGHNLNITNGNGICGMGEKCCKLQNGTNKEEDRALFESSEFTPYHPSQEPIFPPELKLYDKYDKEYVIFRGDNVTWYRPITLSQLLQLKEKYPDAKLVVGNTEVGVEMKFKQMVYPIIIQPVQIPELVKIEQTSKGVKIGASATLVDIETYLKQQIKEQPEYKTRIFRAVVEMMNWFAGKQIRSVGALGSNIMTGSPISDMIPLLMAAKSTLEFLSSKNGIREVTLDNNFFVGYRKTIIKPDEILFSILIPYTTEWQYFTAYKQARRREDDIAIVNEAVNVSFKPNTNLIETISFGIGGMSFKTLSAPKTESKLKGLPWNKSTVDLALNTLLEDLPLDPGAPGGMISYRRSLPMSLFFKAFLSISLQLQKCLPNIELEQRELSGASGFSSHDYKSSQYFQVVPETQEKIDAVHRPIVHMSAYKQATGEAVYSDDIPTFEGELHCGFVISTKPHAKIVNIDESEAITMKGVHSFISGKDVDKRFQWGSMFHDEEVFYSDKVTAVGQIIGLVVADTQVIAQRAAKKVKIIYQELEPVIISIEDAIKHKSFFQSSPLIVKGDVDEVFKEAPHILEGECRTGSQEHFYFETQSCIVIPKAEDHELEVFSSTQNPTEVSTLISEALGIPQNKIITKVKRLGGGFGGKESKAAMLVIPIAVAAKKINRPIRCMLDRDEDMMMTGARHPFYYKYKVAIDNDGKILACEAELYSNAGYSRDLSTSVMDRAITHIDNAYNIPACRILGTPCKTNLPSNTAFRGFGGPQGMYLAESMVEQIATYLNKDPAIIREINLYKPGDVTHYNQLVENCTLDKCWKECFRTSDYVNRRKSVEEFNRCNKYKKRGLSVIPTKFGVAFGVSFLNQTGALVLIYKDGSVLVSHGGVEMGQGLHTKMIQVASRALGIPVEKIHISETATDKVPNTSPTAASTGSDLNGMAIINACDVLNERLKPYKESNPNATWEEWIKSAYLDRVSLSSTGFYKTPDVGHNYETGEGRLYNYYTFGAACSEVEIDTLTGDHQVLRTDIVMDLGESLNPAIDIGQIEGAFMQGYGLFVLEEMMYTPKGETITRGPGTYKIPGFGDIPKEFNVSLLKGVSNPRAVYSSKAVGEPPLFLASSIMFAIKDAIKAARAENNVTGYFRLDAPVTSAKIRMACHDEITSKIQEPKPGSFKPWNIVA